MALGHVTAGNLSAKTGARARDQNQHAGLQQIEYAAILGIVCRLCRDQRLDALPAEERKAPALRQVRALALHALHFVIPGNTETTIVGNMALSWASAWWLLGHSPPPTWLPWAVALGVLLIDIGINGALIANLQVLIDVVDDVATAEPVRT